jgi:hypothetical protein
MVNHSIPYPRIMMSEFLIFFSLKEVAREYEIIYLKEIEGTLIIKYRGAKVLWGQLPQFAQFGLWFACQ